MLINIIGTMFPERKKNVKRYSETPKKVFICSPLRPHDETEEEKQKELHRNQLLALFACRYAAEHGYMPMAPHLYFTQFMDDADPRDREDGIRYGLKWLEDCDEIWVIERRITEGMKREIAAARKRGMREKHFVISLRPEERLLNELIGECFVEMYGAVNKRTFD